MPTVSFKSDLHPFECGQACVHCRKVNADGHNPAGCAFCWVDLVDRLPVLRDLFLEIFEPQRLLCDSQALIVRKRTNA